MPMKFQLTWPGLNILSLTMLRWCCSYKNYGEVVKTCVLTQLTLSLSHPLLLLLPASVHTPVADRVLLLVLRDLIKDKQGHGDPFDAIFQHVPLAPALVHGFQQPELEVAAALTTPLALAASSPLAHPPYYTALVPGQASAIMNNWNKEYWIMNNWNKEYRE